MSSLSFLFLDVGQGDGTLIECPGGEFILVDLGSKKNADIAGKDAVGTIVNELKERKKTSIDYLFLTHGDGDHYNLIEALCAENVSFDRIYFGGETSDYSGYVKKLLEMSLLKSNSTGRANRYCFSSGVYGNGTCSYQEPLLQLGDVRVYVLAVNVKDSDISKRKNSGSLVLMFEYPWRDGFKTGTHKAILMGDAEPCTEEFIMKNFKKEFLRAELLKLAHHGSRGSNGSEWLETVSPRIVTASGDQKWGHPDKETLDRVRKLGTLWTMYEHTYVQGAHVSGKNDYDWETKKGTEAILTNLYKIDGSLGKSWQAHGVAYRVEFNSKGKASIGATVGKSWSLYEPQKGKKADGKMTMSEIEYEQEDVD